MGERPRPSQTPRGDKAYDAPGTTVYYDAGRCRHFAECVRGLPSVFDAGARPWIRPEGADPATLAEVIRRCPTGALHYAIDAVGPEQGEDVTTVAPLPDGPLLLRGRLTVLGSGGGAEPMSETRMAACACGRTTNAPFCDGSCAAAPPGRPADPHESVTQHHPG